MYISKLLNMEEEKCFTDDETNECAEHRALGERLKKTLYFGRAPGTDRPSLPLTELAVEYFRDAAPRELGCVDLQFASSVARKAYMSPCSLMVGMTYIRRLKRGNPEYLQRISSSDLFLISVLVASKYMYDEGTDDEIFNDEWADNADMETEDLNELERDFLREIDWNLYVGQEEFANVLRTIEGTIAKRKGRQRGFFTYSDLQVLSVNLEMLLVLNEILQQLSKMLLVCSVAYVAGTLTIAASPSALQLISSCIQPTTSSFKLPPLCPNLNKTDDTIYAADHRMADEPTDHSLLSHLSSFVQILTVLKESMDFANDQLPSPTYNSAPTTSQWTCSCGPCLSSSSHCVNVSDSHCATSMCCCQPHSMPSLHQGFVRVSLGFQTEAFG